MEHSWIRTAPKSMVNCPWQYFWTSCPHSLTNRYRRTLFCDNKATVDTVNRLLTRQRPDFPNDSLRPSWDLLQSLRTYYRTHPTLALGHILGHQDKNVPGPHDPGYPLPTSHPWRSSGKPSTEEIAGCTPNRSHSFLHTAQDWHERRCISSSWLAKPRTCSQYLKTPTHIHCKVPSQVAASRKTNPQVWQQPQAEVPATAPT
jgi:hypothetical protein